MYEISDIGPKTKTKTKTKTQKIFQVRNETGMWGELRAAATAFANAFRTFPYICAYRSVFTFNRVIKQQFVTRHGKLYEKVKLLFFIGYRSNDPQR